MNRMKPPNYFGHPELLSKSRRMFTATAIKDTFVIRVTADAYAKVRVCAFSLQWLGQRTHCLALLRSCCPHRYGAPVTL